jgi:hypothetical protein
MSWSYNSSLPCRLHGSSGIALLHLFGKCKRRKPAGCLPYLVLQTVRSGGRRCLYLTQVFILRLAQVRDSLVPSAS